jgi:nucleotide-binding universal stress UspA family protein
MPMLVRLQGALGYENLADQMVLLSRPPSQPSCDRNVNLVVGYDSSPKSQIALDITLWIAYQTRIATTRDVTVQVVYVIESEDYATCSINPSDALFNPTNPEPASVPNSLPDAKHLRELFDVRHQYQVNRQFSELADPACFSAAAPALKVTPAAETSSAFSPTAVLSKSDQFAQADQILWQARCLADEWRGSLKTHLRIGHVAKELRQVVEAEQGTLLVVGCDTPHAPLVQSLGAKFPCPVIGIPVSLQS